MQSSSLPVALMSMIDIDASILFQAAIVLVLFAILRPLVFEPFLQSSALRLAKTDEARREAEDMAARAQAMVAKYEAELSSARAAAHAARGELRAEGQRHKDATVTAARGASAEQLNALRETLDADTTRVRADLSGQVEALSKAIVDRILGRAA